MEGPEPFVHLMWKATVGRYFQAIRLDIDMSFKHPGALGIGDEHRIRPVRIFMRRKSDGIFRIPVAEKIDLIKLQFGIFRRIKRNAMIDAEWDISIGKKRNDVVHVLEGRPASRDNHRLLRSCDFFNQNPVV